MPLADQRPAPPPNDPADAWAKRVAALRDRVAALLTAGRLRDAEAACREARAAAPDEAGPALLLGEVLERMGNRLWALDLFREAASRDPDDAVARDAVTRVERALAEAREGGLSGGEPPAEHALAALNRDLSGLRAAVDAVAAALPDPLAQLAFPLGFYGSFRDAYGGLPPPPGPAAALTILLLADREPADGLERQIAALQAQAYREWTLLAVGRDADRRVAVERAAVRDSRVAWHAMDPGDEPAVAEWKAARGVPGGWLLFLAQGAVPQPHALGWFAAAGSLAAARAFVCDADRIVERGSTIEHAEPAFRQVVDHDTLLERNVFGETLVAEADAYRSAVPEVPDGSVTRLRSRLLLELSRRGLVGHIPLALVASLEVVPLSLPEHRAAVEGHLAAYGLAGRVAVARGETGPTLWRPQRPETAITVVVPTRDNADELRDLVRSLRETAAVPDVLRFVIADRSSTSGRARAVLEELAARRYVTAVAPASRWAGLNALVETASAPILVFADPAMLMITDGWDGRLRGLLERDDVGAVGVRGLYLDKTIQHAGVLFGWRGGVVHDGVFEPADAPGPARRWQIIRAVSAVSGSFMATRRDRFLAVGGFDAAVPAAYGDVDYALKLREAGLKILWTPAITLHHLGTRARALDHADDTEKARQAAADAAMAARWGEGFSEDPGLNPVWHPATVPFRLLAAPSSRRVLRHMARCGAPNPWLVRRTGPR